jgi:hypothetical protein
MQYKREAGSTEGKEAVQKGSKQYGREGGSTEGTVAVRKDSKPYNPPPAQPHIRLPPPHICKVWLATLLKQEGGPQLFRIDVECRIYTPGVVRQGLHSILEHLIATYP